MLMKFSYEKLLPKHYNEVTTLWMKTEGVGLGKGDTEEELTNFLERNEGFCYIARNDNQIVGTLLCGHDGRRGYLYHVAVDKDFRMKGIAKKMVEMSLKELKNAGIGKCHLFVFKSNTEAQSFWSEIGWKERADLVVMSKDI
jgi:ribosomal protein S18 acetylase RimI-like enzyme